MTILSPERRRTLATLALLLGPVALVKGAAALLGSGAPVVEAATPLDGPILAAPPAASPTRGESAASARVRELGGLPFGPSPMYYERRGAAAPADVPEIVPAPGLEVSVSMVMRSGDASIALINGRPCRTGELIEGGPWRISAIDIEQRSVEFTNTLTGATHTAVVPMPR